MSVSVVVPHFVCDRVLAIQCLLSTFLAARSLMYQSWEGTGEANSRKSPSKRSPAVVLMFQEAGSCVMEGSQALEEGRPVPVWCGEEKAI